VGVVSATAELDVVDRGLATRIHVMKFEKPSLGAAATVPPDERASTTISQTHCPLDRRRDVAPVAGPSAARTRPIRSGELLPGQILEQDRQRSIDYLGNVSIGNPVPEQVLRPP
jgi:hypothetical protein